MIKKGLWGGGERGVLSAQFRLAVPPHKNGQKIRQDFNKLKDKELAYQLNNVQSMYSRMSAFLFKFRTWEQLCDNLWSRQFFRFIMYESIVNRFNVGFSSINTLHGCNSQSRVRFLRPAPSFSISWYCPFKTYLLKENATVLFEYPLFLGCEGILYIHIQSF
jgi:hypothetical protein